MQQQSSSGENSAGIVSIILIYVTLIVLILVFAQQLLSEISRGTVLARFVFVPLAVVMPLFLVLIVAYNIVRLVRQRKRGLPGSRFKVKLVIFFTFISILASIPQGILSISFIRTTMNSWFSNQLYTALQGGLDIALDYNRTIVNNLSEFSKSELLPDLVQKNFDTPSL
ncbi:MAG: two-component sensor histidine kinase, partial [Spirochaetota bacterium]|nr:two-component sensor histidine kinase [Spirochaetota bacterium]